MKRVTGLVAVLAALPLMGCAGVETISEQSESGRVMCVLKLDEQPDRVGYRYDVFTRNQEQVEVIQYQHPDEPMFRAGDKVRIEGQGSERRLTADKEISG